MDPALPEIRCELCSCLGKPIGEELPNVGLLICVRCGKRLQMMTDKEKRSVLVNMVARLAENTKPCSYPVGLHKKKREPCE